jgi:hypothetical protein
LYVRRSHWDKWSTRSTAPSHMHLHQAKENLFT